MNSLGPHFVAAPRYHFHRSYCTAWEWSLHIDTYKKTLFVAGKSVSVSYETQLAIEKLLFFEWLTKLQDYEF